MASVPPTTLREETIGLHTWEIPHFEPNRKHQYFWNHWQHFPSALCHSKTWKVACSSFQYPSYYSPVWAAWMPVFTQKYRESKAAVVLITNPSMEKRSHTGKTKRFIKTSVMWGYTHKQTSKGWPWWWLVSSNVAVKISCRKVVNVFIISRSAVVRCTGCYCCLKNRAAAVKPSRGRNSHKITQKDRESTLTPHRLKRSADVKADREEEKREKQRNKTTKSSKCQSCSLCDYHKNIYMFYISHKNLIFRNVYFLGY